MVIPVSLMLVLLPESPLEKQHKLGIFKVLQYFRQTKINSTIMTRVTKKPTESQAGSSEASLPLSENVMSPSDGILALVDC